MYAKTVDYTGFGNRTVTVVSDASNTKVARIGRSARHVEEWRKAYFENKDAAFLYFMADSDGRIKIGHSKSPARRLKEIQSNPYWQVGEGLVKHKITLLAFTSGGHKTERMLHMAFDEFRYWGEWFDPNPELDALIMHFAVAA